MNIPLLDDPIRSQNNLIAKVYGLLSCQIIITIITIIIGKHYYQKWILNNPIALYLAGCISLIALLFSFCLGDIYPINYFILIVFTLSESYLVTYLAILSNNNNIILA